MRVDNKDIAILSVRKNLHGVNNLGVGGSDVKNFHPEHAAFIRGDNTVSPGFAILPDEKMYFKRAP